MTDCSLDFLRGMEAAARIADDIARHPLLHHADAVGAAIATAIRDGARKALEPVGQEVSIAGPQDARTALWTDGLLLLMRITGLPQSRARVLMGKLLREAGDHAADLHGAIRDCPPTKLPGAWLQKAAAGIKARATGRMTVGQIRDDWNLPTFAAPSLFDDAIGVGND